MKSDTTYIYYQYGQHYTSDKRYAIPERACIGKLDSNGMLIPNENYRKYFPGVDLPGEKPQAFRSCLRIGTVLVVRWLYSGYGLPKMLGEYFVPRDLGLFLDLAAYSPVCEDNAAQYYPDAALRELEKIEMIKGGTGRAITHTRRYSASSADEPCGF